MIKAFSAIAAAAFIAAALTVLPGFAPQVEASVPQALAKGDRLDIRTVGKDCSQQAWPNFEASCLRAAGSKLGGEGSAPGYRRPHPVTAQFSFRITSKGTAVMASRDAPLLAICVPSAVLAVLPVPDRTFDHPSTNIEASSDAVHVTSWR